VALIERIAPVGVGPDQRLKRVATALVCTIGTARIIGSVWQGRLDRREARWLRRHREAGRQELELFTVEGAEDDAPRCVVGGLTYEYRTARETDRFGSTVGFTVQVVCKGSAPLIAASPHDPRVLDARAMRAGLNGTVLGLPFTATMSRRGLSRRQRKIRITLGAGALRYGWGRSRPVLAREADPTTAVMSSRKDESYALHRPLMEVEELLAVALAMGMARRAIRSPVLGFLEAVFDAF
jgi:hypothetical protein